MNRHAMSQYFPGAMFPYPFIPTVTKPTRVTYRSGMLTDNIFNGNYVEIFSSLGEIPHADLSDHFRVCQIIYSNYVPSVDNSFNKT